MKPIFHKGPSLQSRLLLVVVLSIVMIIVDSQTRCFIQIRNYLDTSVSPLYFLVNESRQLIDNIYNILASRQKLDEENKILRQELFLKNTDLLILEQYKQENIRLRELLGSPVHENEHKMITQVLSTNTDWYNDQIVIDKGRLNNVYEGQPLISDKGVVGQVVAVGQITSRVLLICNVSHALPIQVLRNDVRSIAIGNGCNKDLKLEHLPNNIDIRVGDMLVTSGLGGRFPEGYPVAIVSSVKIDIQRAITLIKARPTASLKHLRYLLLWGTHQNNNEKMPMTPNEVRHIANERIMMKIPSILNHTNKYNLYSLLTSQNN